MRLSAAATAALAALVLLLLTCLCSASQDRIHLRDIPSLVFAQGAQTSSRRGKYYPQLVRTGGSAGAGVERELANVLCTNQGFDGAKVNWRCEAHLPDNAALGNFEILCEGYDGPNDDYSLRGSCSLEYELNYRVTPGPTGQPGPTGTPGYIYVEPRQPEVVTIHAGPGVVVIQHPPGQGPPPTVKFPADPAAAPRPPPEGRHIHPIRGYFNDLWDWMGSVLWELWIISFWSIVILFVLVSCLAVIVILVNSPPTHHWSRQWFYWHPTHVTNSYTHIHEAPYNPPAPRPATSYPTSAPSWPSFSFGSSTNRGSSSKSSSSSSSSSGGGSKGSTSSSSGSSRNR